MVRIVVEIDRLGRTFLGGTMRVAAALVLGLCTCSPAGVPAGSDGAPRFVELDAGNFHTCARTDDGAVECWGQCGLQCGARPDGVTARLPVAGVTDAVELAVGDAHACARTANGDVTCWGSNYGGGLGRAEPERSPVPMVVPDVHGAVELAIGGDLTCARLRDGGVMCWGAVAGDYDRSPESTALRLPRRVDGLEGATGIDVSARGACARTEAGAWMCWRWDAREPDFRRHMGPATADPRRADVVQSTEGTCECDLGTDGVVHCRGTGILSARLADGSSPPIQLHHCPADGLAGVRTLAGRCAIMDEGTVRCWGEMFFGRGDAAAIYDDLREPTSVPGITDAKQLGIGTGHICVLSGAGALDCWGDNTHGQIDGVPAEHGVWPPRRIEPPARR